MSSKNEKGQPWYQWVYRWGQTNLTEDDPENCDLAFWKEQWARTRVQGVIVNCGGIVAYYPSKFGMQYRAALLGERDYYKEFSDAATQAGLVVVARMDINRATQEFYQAHPDWFCRDKAGNPIVSQGRYFSCVNSDYYKVFIPDVLQEIMERYHPAGFTDNSWKGLTRNTICYCDNCRSKFQSHCGQELPQAVDWNDPVYRTWIRWSYQCRTDNWDLFNQVTTRHGGKDCLWLGMLNADIGGSAVALADLKALCERSKLVFSDHQSRDVLNGFEQNSMNGSLFRFATEEQVLVPESMANYVRGRRSFRLAANPAQETRSWIAAGMAGGISPWYHHVGGGRYDRRQFETSVSLFQWHQQNDQYLYDRISLANVAVLWNQETFDFYGRDQMEERCVYPFSGICLALSRSRIPFFPMHASDLARYQSRIDTLVLPNVAILSDAQADAICAFVEQGGNLVMLGETDTRDAQGEEKTESRLWKLLGLRLTGRKHGAFGNQTGNWEYDGSHNYLLLPDQRHPVLQGFDSTDLIAFGGGFLETISEGTLQPVAGYIPPFPIYPPEFSWIRTLSPDLTTIFAGTLPGGSRVVYLGADIDRCYGKERLPDHGNLLANAIRFAMGDRLPLLVEGAGKLDCALYAQPQHNRRIVHLVNLTGCAVNPGYCEQCVAVGPITVSLPAQGAQKVQLLVAGTELPFAVDGDRITISIPRILEHEVLVVE